MLDKEKIKNNFTKGLKSYDDNAYIQKIVASKLISYIPIKKYASILEVGSYSGILTKKIVNNIEFDNYLALDIIDSFSLIENLSPKIKTCVADIENIELNQKFDLIVSTSSLQWCSDLFSAIKKLKSYLSDNGSLIISIFAKDNLYEIRESFDLSLNYPSIDEIKTLLPDAKIFDEKYVLQFDNSLELLRHLKLTGVNSLSEKTLSIKEIKKNLKILDEKYKNKLTYNPLYIID